MNWFDVALTTSFFDPGLKIHSKHECWAVKWIQLDEVSVISKATDEMNEKHLQYQIDDFIKHNSDKDKIVEIDFVTYKKDSILIEESQQLKFAIKLKELGYNIEILDQREEVLTQIKDIL